MNEWFCVACAVHHQGVAPAVEKQMLPSGVMLRACDRLLEPYADTIRDFIGRELARRPQASHLASRATVTAKPADPGVAGVAKLPATLTGKEGTTP